jgi:hypothetical protein
MMLTGTENAKCETPTFQSRMEKKASGPNDQVSQEGNQEYLLVPFTPAIKNALDAQEQEQEVR